MTQQATTRHELEAKIIAKAWQDEAFKQELINNPKAAIIREMGLVEMPDNLDFRVLEENANTFYLVLPMKPEITEIGGELSSEELEAVAGGTWTVTIPLTVSAIKTLIGGIQKCLS